MNTQKSESVNAKIVLFAKAVALSITFCLSLILSAVVVSGQQTRPDDELIAAASKLHEENPALFEGAQGIMVLGVQPASQAEKAGLQRGDIIIQYGRTAVDTALQFITLTGTVRNDEEVSLRYVRKEKLESATLNGGRIGVEIKDISQPAELKTLCEEVNTLSFCASALSNYPLEAAALFGKASIYHQRKKYDAAIAEYKEMTALAPNSAEAYGRIGWLLIEAGRPEEAREYSRKACELKQDNATWTRNLGHTFFLKGDMDRAREYYRKALAMISSEDDVAAGAVAEFGLFAGKGWRAEESRQWAIWFQKGFADLQEAKKLELQFNELYSNGKFATLMPIAQKTLEIRENTLGEDHSAVAESLINLAMLYNSLERYADAEPLYTRALTIRTKVLGREHPDVAGILDKLGFLYKTTERYDDAEPLFKQALAIREKVLGPEHPDTARSLLRLTTLYLQTGRHAEAEPLYHSAVTIVTKSLNVAEFDCGSTIFNLKTINMIDRIFKKQDHPLMEAASEYALGNCKSEMCFYTDALEHYQNAVGIFEKLNKYKDQGDVYQKMGQINCLINNYAKALELYQKALLSYQNDENEPSRIANSSFVFLQLGGLRSDTGDYAGAEELYLKALSGLEKVADLSGQGMVYLARGENEYRREEYEKAINLCQNGISFLEKAEEKKILKLAYLLMAEINVDIHHYQDAMLLFAKAGKNNKDREVMWTVIAGMGKCLLGKGDFEGGLLNFSIAVEHFEKIGNVEKQALSSIGQAEAFDKLNKPAEALKCYETALRLLEKIRGKAMFDDYKRNYLKRMSINYESAAGFMIRQGYAENGFRVVESMKARLFLDQLAEARIDLEKGIEPELKKQRDELERELSQINARWQNELKQNALDKQKVSAIRKEYEKKEIELEELKKTIRLKNPVYSQVEYPQPVTVEVLQKEILQKDEVILEYLLTEDNVYRFSVSRDSFDIIKLPVTVHELEEDVRALREFVIDSVRTERSDTGLITQNDLRERRLYDALIAPGLDKIQGKTLFIVPDGILARLPFELLKSGDRHAVELHDLRYVQSASVLEMLRAHYKRNGAAGFVGFGDPVYDYNNFKAGKPEKGAEGQRGVPEIMAADLIRSGYLRRGGPLDRLPASGEEVKAIASLFAKKDEKSRLHLRIEAREEIARSKGMEEYAYIHFSTHGILNDRLQAIALSQIPDSGSDGFLTIGKLMNCRYNARLVALSACETGLGKEERGEGVTGLTRAVMYAGTPAAVVSLWRVSDEGAKELMIRMYKGMLEKGRSPGDALRQAKLEMLRGRDFQYPYFWAAFVMYGE